MDFELAATLHKQWEKVRAASLLADELVRPLDQLRALILQEASPLEEDDPHPEAAAVFLFAHGNLAGPEPLSTLGVRAVREQTAVGSSLFAQPLMLAPIPLNDATDPGAPCPDPGTWVSTEAPQTPEDRARAVLDTLTARTQTPPDMAEFCDHLSLLRRWYYRPEKQRSGEVFLPSASPNNSAGDVTWPIRRILNGAARIALGPPAPLSPADREAAREAAKTLKTKILHPGREGVQREVPVLPKRTRTRKAITPTDLT